MKTMTISTDKSALDVLMIHQFLTERSYWAKGRTLETVQRSIANSLCFGAYNEVGKQVAFARVVTDSAVFGWLLDVFVLEDSRGLGIGKQLMEAIVSHPDLKGLKRMGLGTDDAHELYRAYGFTGLSKPDNMMERLRK